MENDPKQETKRILPDTIPIEVRKDQVVGSVEKTIKTKPQKKQRKSCCSGCGCIVLIMFLLLVLYFLLPFANRFLLLGIDRAPSGSMLGRSDTIMVFSVDPLLPTVKVLAIPRDLWVPIPQYGENRINTAHFFAEAQQAGAGPDSALRTVNQNFGFNVRYYLRFNLENFPAAIDALGGVTITLSQPMSGYPAGSYHLNGTQALAFVRSRSDGDDFFRIRQGQVFLVSFIRQIFNPVSWPGLPQFLVTLPSAMDTNIPIWLWPRMGLAMLRTSFSGIEFLVIDRSMVTPFLTSEGARVLLPNWQEIDAYVAENFR